MTVLAFDLGGVLFTDGTAEFAAHLHDDHGVDLAQARHLLTGPLGSAYRRGELTRDAFWHAFRQALGLSVPADELAARWIDGYRLDSGTRDLIRQLSRHHGVYYLSDNVAERVDAVERRHRFLGLFTGGVFSHEAGVRKPDPRIYQVLLDRTGVEARHVVYIDDKDWALVPAAALGMTTILFRGSGHLRRELVRLGLLPGDQ
ncbi:MAG: HAD family phosphatase [Hamadaea sp.]|nr:HAD family phosphatase [Hamadaea sp.]